MTDLRAYARQVAQKYGLDQGLFERQINQESGFNPNPPISAGGAVGIAQIVPKYHPGVNANDPLASLEYAARWMASMAKKYASNVKALIGYNAGEAYVVGGTVNGKTIPPWDGSRGALPAETRKYLDIIIGTDWAPGGTIPGLPTERPSWWPAGWQWPPLGGLPTLPTLPTADAFATFLWETFDGFRKTVRDKIVENAKSLSATFGGPVAFWIVGSMLVTFGLIGLSIQTGTRVMKAYFNSKPVKIVQTVATRGGVKGIAKSGAAVAGAVI